MEAERHRQEKLTITVRRADHPDGVWFIITEWTPANGVPRQTIKQIDGTDAQELDEMTAWQLGRAFSVLVESRLF